MSVGSTISLFGSSKRTRKVFGCLEGLCTVPFVDGDSLLLGFNIEVKKFSLLSSVIAAVTLRIHRRLTSSLLCRKAGETNSCFCNF